MKHFNVSKDDLPSYYLLLKNRPKISSVQVSSEMVMAYSHLDPINNKIPHIDESSVDIDEHCACLVAAEKIFLMRIMRKWKCVVQKLRV
eukprot:8667266-Ditylum_brightwellii.AAC.1